MADSSRVVPARHIEGSSSATQQSQASDQDPVALCKLDEYLMSVAPGYKPSTAAELRDFLFSFCGATEETLDACLQNYDHIMQEKIDRGGVIVIGMKPAPGDPNVYSVRVPDSPYALRMWEGGMATYGHFCLDFYDTERKAPVNLPPGHALYMAGFGPGMMHAAMPPPGFGRQPQPGEYLPRSVRHHIEAHASGSSSRSRMRGGLGSWERNLGMKSIPEGEEKWSFPEGQYVTLRRDGHPDFTFQMPTRQMPVAVAQPRLGVI
ncbi:hypothetical protein GSI_11252 [Ganoderma sinense ZZ0214-1]|uniref:Uncharacterized protein n=1 Tax=Ganoderma sinense ZZ0214-1 TaxID=1077348 RepID=A0A2G8RYT0_9APHY|nr:hypothetical protein GSI_11252 [Ganoderma sinense ZZ0214-1]